MAYDFNPSRTQLTNNYSKIERPKITSDFSKIMKAIFSPVTTITDVAEDVVTGAVRGVEGIVDYGIGLLGSAASIFGSDDLDRALSEAIKYDFAGNTVGKLDDWAEDSSWVSGDDAVSDTIHQVAGGIGQMLPGILVTVFTGGAGASAAVASLAGTATFAAGAAGQSTAEALDEGANIRQATTYGTLSGVTEGAIEYVSGKLGGVNLFSKGAGKSIVGGGLKSLLKSYVEEGTEEVASDLINPLWKSITYSGKYETPELSELVQSFNVGGLTALAMGGAGKASSVAKYGVDGSKAESIYNEILELNQEEYNLEKSGKLTEELAKEYAKKRNDLAQELNGALEKLDKESKKYKKLYQSIDPESAISFDVKKQAAYETVDGLNKKFGTNLNVEFVTDKKMSELRKENNDKSVINGYYDIKNNKIVINENSTDPYSVVVAHEITHSTENNQLYNEISNEILSTMSQEELSNAKAELKKVYVDKISDNQLNKEIVANYISEMLGSDSKTLLRTFTRKPNVVTRVLEWLESKVSSSKQNNAESKAIISLRNKVRNLLSQNNVVDNNAQDGVELSRRRKYLANKDTVAQKFGDSVKTDIEKSLMKYYKETGEEIVDDHIVKSGNSLYVVDSGIENNNIKYAVYKKFDYEQEMIDIAKEVAEKYGFKKASRRNIRKIIRNGGSVGSVDGVIGESSKSGKSVENTERKSSNNSGRISGENGNQSVEDSRKSRKPPEGQLELDLFNDVAIRENTQTTVESKEKNVDEIIDKTSKQIKTTLPRENETVKDTILKGKEALKDFIDNRNEYKINLQLQFTNAFAGIETRAKAFFTNQFKEQGLTGKELNAAVNEEMIKFKALELKALKADSGANYMIGTDLYEGIWKDINAKGVEYTNLFESFLLHRLNIKRMNYEYLDPKKAEKLKEKLKAGKITQEQYEMRMEEATEIIKKPVFGEEVSAEDSAKVVEKLEKEHPEFVDLAQKVYDYLNVLMDIRVKCNLVSKEQREFMKLHYGDWYVPSYRESEHGANVSGISGKGNVGVTKGVHAAKGSNLDVQSIMKSMAQQTVGVHKQAIMNELFLKVKSIDPDAFVEKDTARQTRNDVDGIIEPKDNEVFFYENGKRTTYMTTKDIAVAFENLRNNKNNAWEQSVAAKGLEKLVSAMKKMTTEYNLFFAVRNLFRDASDAFIYTKYSKNLLKRYKRAYAEIKNKGEYYKLYLQNGGQALSFFDREYGVDLRKKNLLLDKISMINETTELLPRLSEFIESIESRYDGDLKNVPQEVVDMAMYDASDVTVNFARGGTFTKKLNKYLMPYLNASVQGWCKTWNTFVHPTSMKAWCMAMSKVVIMALPTLLFNEIFYDDDEEYQQLSDDIKGSYFLIKTGNNKFIRIPRGRVEAVVGDAMQRIYRTTRGEEDAFDGYIENTVKNVSPVDNLTRTILSPITDINTNTTWYGGQIENQSMQSLPINERYDANTSEIAKIMNKVVPSVSPKKWHYLLEQYSGILGDVVLPLTSKNKDLSGISGLRANSLENNKYTNKYYDVMEELEQKKNSANGTAVDKAKMRYFNNANNKIRELYQAKKNSTDKEEQLAIQAMIVKLQKTTLEGVNEFGKVLDKYSYGLSQEELYEDYYREATRECFGAEIALLNYDNRVYEKATIFNKCGINWDTFYNIYFDVQDIYADYDADGKVINGSKKEKVTKYVKSLKLTSTQKYMVMGLLGYKNANGESQVRSFLRSKGYYGEELKSIMKICGYDN